VRHHDRIIGTVFAVLLYAVALFLFGFAQAVWRHKGFWLCSPFAASACLVAAAAAYVWDDVR
jgi:hypothetical protein